MSAINASSLISSASASAGNRQGSLQALQAAGTLEQLAAGGAESPSLGTAASLLGSAVAKPTRLSLSSLGGTLGASTPAAQSRAIQRRRNLRDNIAQTQRLMTQALASGVYTKNGQASAVSDLTTSGTLLNLVV